MVRFSDMCTHQREIKNKYTGQTLYVKCGHCPACLQEKAAYRVSRIKAQDSDEFDTLLVGLTYRRHDVPYVRREDAFKFSRGELLTLPVYRDCEYRKVRQNASYDIGYKKIDGVHKLCEVDFMTSSDFHNLKDLKYKHGCIGVNYYPDVQRFLARLRINLKRNFDYVVPFKTFQCSEYGTKSHRPHFHLLLWVPKGSEETFRSAIVSSWPYGDIQNFADKAVQKAYRASSYVASYVNCGDDFPVFLKKYFKAKHSYSKDFGCNNKLFSLDSVLSKFNRGHLTYFVQKVESGTSEISEFPFPKYIIHRYFPKFKGYGRISPSSACSCMRRIVAISRGETNRFLGSTFYEYSVSNDLNKSGSVIYSPDPLDDVAFLNRMAFPVYYCSVDIHKIGVRLYNAYNRFLDCLGRYMSLEDYFKLHVKVWNCYNADILRLHLQNYDIPLNEKYDNLENIRCSYDEGVRNDLPLGFTREMLKVTDPNKFSSTIVNTGRFTISYYDHLKHRSVSNVIFSSVNEEF